MSKLLKLYDCWHAEDISIATSSASPAERVVLLCASFGWTVEDMGEIALGPALPIREAIRQCQLQSPELWPKAAYALLARADQIAMMDGPLGHKSNARSSDSVSMQIRRILA
jgi:hypothetical protein